MDKGSSPMAELDRQTPQWREAKANPSTTYCPLSLVTSTKTLILILGAGVGETPQEREVTAGSSAWQCRHLPRKAFFCYSGGTTGLLPAWENQGAQG